jgi:hypothetical protein
MAAYTPSGIGVGQLSGKLGNDVYARNRYGSYIRTGINDFNAGSSKQLAWQAKFAAVEAKWQTITESQREAWNAAAESGIWDGRSVRGNPIQLAGHSLFLKLNGALERLLLFNAEPPERRYFEIENLPFAQTLVRNNATDLSLTTSAATLPADTRIYTWATIPLKKGVMRPRKSDFRFLYHVAASLYTPTRNWYSPYNFFISAITPGDKIFIRSGLLDQTTGEIISLTHANVISAF